MALTLSQLLTLHKECVDRIGAMFEAEAHGVRVPRATIEQENALADDLEKAIELRVGLREEVGAR